MLLSKGSILIAQGCDNVVALTVHDKYGMPVDLTGCEPRFRIADKMLTSRYVEVIGDSDPSVGTIVVDGEPTEGKIRLDLKPIDKLALPSNNEEGEASLVQANNIYSVVIKDTDGRLIKVAQGDCYIEVEL